MAEKNTKTKICFEYDGQEITLEYTADALKKMENDGFDFSNVEHKIFTAPAEMFCGAFIANHPGIPKKTRLKIYEDLCAEAEDSKDTVMDAIGQMLSEAVDEMTRPRGNVKWRVVK